MTQPIRGADSFCLFRPRLSAAGFPPHSSLIHRAQILISPEQTPNETLRPPRASHCRLLFLPLQPRWRRVSVRIANPLCFRKAKSPCGSSSFRLLISFFCLLIAWLKNTTTPRDGLLRARAKLRPTPVLLWECPDSTCSTGTFSPRDKRRAGAADPFPSGWKTRLTLFSF